MNSLIEMMMYPGLEYSRAAKVGRRLVALGLGVKATHGLVATVIIFTFGLASASAQTPSGSFFNGDSSQLGNSLRSITFFLAAAMIIAGIIFVAVGIITSGLRESLSTWKFIPERRASRSAVSVLRFTRSVRVRLFRWIINSKKLSRFIVKNC